MVIATIEICTISCTHIEIDGWNLNIVSAESAEELHDVPLNKSVSNALKRAEKMVKIQWLPLRPVPNILGTFYPKGHMVSGIPYSSGKELCTFVGQDVSFYTFLSAVNNPYSYLYTQDLSRPPYNSSLCRTYFGTVCSAAVDYALGMPIQYTTYMYKDLPFFSVISDISIDEMQLCDLLLEDGHVGMVYDIIRDCNGKIRGVSVFESVHEGTRIKDYTRSQFIARWKNLGWEVLRYAFVEQERKDINDDSLLLEEGMKFNPYLSTAKGDRVSYAKRDSIIVHFLDNIPGTLMVMKDNILFSSVAVSVEEYEYVFKDLQCGNYELYLEKEDSTRTPSIFFDIVDTDVSLEVEEKVTVHFNHRGSVPIYLIFCQLSHRYLSFKEITKDDLANGFISVEPEDRMAYYYKVLFQGKYGRVASELHRVK